MNPRPPFPRRLVHLACVPGLALLCAGTALAQQTAEPQTVVVTATRHAMLALDAPAAMSVVTRQEIEARGADDVLEAVRGETGVSLQGRSIGGRKVISLRGMDPKHTLFLVDGRRVAPSDGVVGHSDFQFDWIPVDDIERIEIVRGPLSVLYGSEALGGVVHVITRQAGDRWRVAARAEGSVASGDRGGDGHRAAVSVDGPLAPGLGLRAGLATGRRDAVASPADAQVSELEGHDKTDGWLGLAWRASRAHRVALDLHAGEETRTADARERSGARRYHVSDNLIARAMASLAWDAEWDERGDTTTQLRTYGTRLDVENRRTGGVAINAPQTLRDRVLEGLVRHDAGAHVLIAGFEARNETLEDPGMPDGRSLARHRALFVQDEWRVIDGARPLDLTLGLRHDDHHLFGRETSPRLYVTWRTAPGWTLKGGFSHGFKAPNLKQIVPGGRPEGPNTVLGNPDLKPETSDAVEAGFAFERQGLELQAMLFSQRVHDLIELELVAPGPVPGVGTYVYQNVARARLRGLELGAAMPLGAGFSAQASTTWLDATDADGERLTYRPRLSMGARLDWSHGPWQAGLRVDHASGTLLPSATRGAPDVAVADLTQWGAYVQRQLGPGLTLALRVHNLTNLRPADKSARYTHAEAPRTVSLALRGAW
ncbi:TonB-dependent receptor plug domain-containing protein [Rubrivivax albus]|nr:TonB-dependent receptor [Rubrivivax albus]